MQTVAAVWRPLPVTGNCTFHIYQGEHVPRAALHGHMLQGEDYSARLAGLLLARQFPPFDSQRSNDVVRRGTAFPPRN